MKYFDFLFTAHFITLSVQIISQIPMPILIILAARRITGIVAPWIVLTFWVTAAAKLVTSIPIDLAHPFFRDILGFQIPNQLLPKIFGALSIFNWWVGLLFCVALWVLCAKIRQLAEPVTALYSEPAA